MRVENTSAEDVAAYRAVERIYHSYLTGLVLHISSRAGAANAAEVVFRMFRRQQKTHFVASLKKLGLDGLPHAVASAQYNYLANQVGGVKVEYIYESDRKAWIRYPPPRWLWSGTAICGIPSEVSRGMLMRLATGELIRRFLIHVLPQGFHRIRHYGLLASGTRADNIARARELLTASKPEGPPTEAAADPIKPDCPCRGGRMIIIEVFERGAAPRYRPTGPTIVVRLDTS